MYNYSHFEKVNRAEFLLLTGEGKSGLNHLKHWVPEFLKAQVKFSILVRSRELFKLVQREYRTLNILLAETALDIESTLTELPSLKAIFFMSNASSNIHVLRFNSYKHIFLGSENSDRDAHVTKVLRAYDELWLASQSSIDKLKSKINIEDLIIRKIGKPQFKGINKLSQKKQSKSILMLVSNESNLYSNSSMFTQIIDILPKEYHLKVVLDPSLGTKNKLLKDLRTQLNEFNWMTGRECSIYDVFTDDLLVNSDYIICDINNYQQKFLAVNALIYLYTPNNISPETIFEDKYISFEYIPQFSNKEELEQIFNEHKILFNKQKVFSEYWLGNSYTLNDEFINNLQHLSVI